MKTTLKFSIIICFTICIFSCAEKEKAREDFYRGIYEGSNRTQEMQSDEVAPLPDKKPPTYEKYKRERQEILTNHEDNPLQQ